MKKYISIGVLEPINKKAIPPQDANKEAEEGHERPGRPGLLEEEALSLFCVKGNRRGADRE